MAGHQFELVATISFRNFDSRHVAPRTFKLWEVDDTALSLSPSESKSSAGEHIKGSSFLVRVSSAILWKRDAARMAPGAAACRSSEPELPRLSSIIDPVLNPLCGARWRPERSPRARAAERSSAGRSHCRCWLAGGGEGEDRLSTARPPGQTQRGRLPFVQLGFFEVGWSSGKAQNMSTVQIATYVTQLPCSCRFGTVPTVSHEGCLASAFGHPRRAIIPSLGGFDISFMVPGREPGAGMAAGRASEPAPTGTADGSRTAPQA